MQLPGIQKQMLSTMPGPVPAPAQTGWVQPHVEVTSAQFPGARCLLQLLGRVVVFVLLLDKAQAMGTALRLVVLSFTAPVFSGCRPGQECCC